MAKKVVLKINGMHCTSCALAIDGTLEDTEGVLQSNTKYAKQETEISFDEEKLSKDKIIEIIKRVGYEAH